MGLERLQISWTYAWCIVRYMLWLSGLSDKFSSRNLHARTFKVYGFYSSLWISLKRFLTLEWPSRCRDYCTCQSMCLLHCRKEVREGRIVNCFVGKVRIINVFVYSFRLCLGTLWFGLWFQRVRWFIMGHCIEFI